MQTFNALFSFGLTLRSRYATQQRNQTKVGAVLVPFANFSQLQQRMSALQEEACKEQRRKTAHKPALGGMLQRIQVV